MAMSETVGSTIAHVLHVTGAVEKLLPVLPAAFRAIMNRHPRMRARRTHEEPLTACIGPHVTLEEANALVTMETMPSHTAEDHWHEFVAETCLQRMDNFNAPPYKLHVLHYPAKRAARLILFSDHYMSDGYSGIIVLNDLLESATNGVFDYTEHPLRPSLLQLMRPHKFWHKLTDQLLVTFAAPIRKWEIRHYKPYLPIDKTIQPLMLPCPTNTSYGLFASGSAVNLQLALARCKEENVTFNGAVLTCLVLAYGLTRDPTLASQETIKIALEIDYNMRHRYKHPFPENPLGFNVMLATIESLQQGGVNVNTQFWDVARRLKAEADHSLHRFLPLVSMVYVDKKLNATVQKLDFSEVIINDANVSNLGAYPFPRTHQFAGGDTIDIEALHLYNNAPKMSPAAIFFLSSVQYCGYSMNHRLDKEPADKLFRLFVRLVEQIGTIKPNERMGEYGRRMDAPAW
jgi:hypothetical protein